MLSDACMSMSSCTKSATVDGRSMADFLRWVSVQTYHKVGEGSCVSNCTICTVELVAARSLLCDLVAVAFLSLISEAASIIFCTKFIVLQIGSGD